MSSRTIEYEMRVEPCAQRLRVQFNGAFVADSARAVVLHETRRPPTYYIPWEDVRSEFLESSTRRTHCPFKGNARYWSLRVGAETAVDAVWAYEEPFDEVAAIRGRCSFDAEKVSAIYEGDEEAPFAADNVETAHANPIAAWLLRDAWRVPAPDALVAALCEALRAEGVPIARMTVIIPTLHPQIFASVFVWRDDTPAVRTILEPHDILRQPKFADSPFAPIIKGAGGLRRRLEGEHPKLDFPVLRDLHAEGATDYIAMPFQFADGQINVMSMTSFAPGGFTTAHLGNIYEVLPILGRLFEVHAQRRVAVGLLETYLGRNTGKRVLEGQIRHGDGQLIHAVVWFCDLRDSTRLSDTMDQASYLQTLNRFFTAMAGAINDCGGEILSYIGDAVLAIFPMAGTAAPHADAAREACENAVRAARLASERIADSNAERTDLPALRYGIGLHIGDVTYGNIGIPERLQFTVIGSAANEASRIESLTKEIGDPVLVSARFATHYKGPLVPRGLHLLRGSSEAQELFGLG